MDNCVKYNHNISNFATIKGNRRNEAETAV